jgi:type I restriction enzyme S subunit
MKRIGDILTRNKTPVVVKDGKSYKQVTIRTNYKGVVLRGSQDGSAILTKNQFAVSAGQFILSRIDARNGAFGIVPEELEGAIVSNEFLAFDINEAEVERDFFNVFLQSPVFLEACIKASRGNTNRKRVEEDFFLNYQVNLPPLREQHALIKQINHGRTNIATAQREITHQETLLAKLQQAILQEAIQGKLTADWRAAHPQAEPARQLLHRIQAEKARLIAAKQLRPEKPLPPITPAEIPFAIPKTWEWCRLGSLFHSLQYGTAQKCSYDSSKNTAVLRIPNVSTGKLSTEDLKYTNLTKAEKEQYSLKKHDVLMIRSNGSRSLVGSAVHFDEEAGNYAYAGYLMRLRFPANIYSPFIVAALASRMVREQIEGPLRTTVGINNVNTTEISRLKIPLPPLAEQAAIVARVETLLGSSRKLAAEIAHTRTHAAHLLQAVLKAAFTPAT